MSKVNFNQLKNTVSALKNYANSILPCKTNDYKIIKTIPAETMKNYTSILGGEYYVINYPESLNLIADKNYRIAFHKYNIICKCISDDDGIRLHYLTLDPAFEGYDIIQIYDKCRMDTSTVESVDDDNSCVIILTPRFFYYFAEDITDCVISIEDVNKLDNVYLNDDVTISNSISVGRVPNSNVGRGSSSIGVGCEATADASQAEGWLTIASGVSSHAEGEKTIASGDMSHAEGENTEASGEGAHSEGFRTVASGSNGHAEGFQTEASGGASHAEGEFAIASGSISHAEGYYTQASSSYQHVQGRYNIEDAENKYAHIVGNGSYTDGRSNAHTLDWDGNAWFAGNVSVEGTPTNNNDLTTKKYVDEKVAGIVNSAPEALDTLQELANALGNDASFATTVTTNIGNKVDKVDGKGLSTNDLTDELKTNYDAAYAYSQATHSYNDLTDKPEIPSIDGLATTEYVDVHNLIKEFPLRDPNSPAVYLNDITESGLYMLPKKPDGTSFTTLGFKLEETTTNTVVKTWAGSGYASTPCRITIRTNGNNFANIDSIVIEYKAAATKEECVWNRNPYFLTNTNTLAFDPISDYNPATKKYVDDAKASIVVPTKTSELTNDSGFLTEHQSLADYAKTEYVDSKTSIENVIYDGDGTGDDVIFDYWTHCAVNEGLGCWVINKSIDFDFTKPNPYYLLCDNTLYTPDNSKADTTNNAWIYDEHNEIFICNRYNNFNKLILPWDGAGSPQRIKLFTRTEITKIIGNLEASDEEINNMLIEVLGGDYSVNS